MGRSLQGLLTALANGWVAYRVCAGQFYHAVMTKPATTTPPSERPWVLVTGASRGIGAATAQACAQAGWNVAINYVHNQAAAQQVAAAAQAVGAHTMLLQADVADEAQVLRMFQAIDAAGHRLQGLVNNAGVVDVRCRVDAMTVARLERMFRVNVIGSIVCAREAVRRMSTAHGGQGGSIVNLSSVAAKLGSPAWYVDYAASKAAIDTFTLGLAREVAAEGVRVNGVRPGIIDTDIHASGGEADRVRSSVSLIPMNRVGRADEIAPAIVWLLSQAASYTTGTTIDVSGGR
jgi:NAD(P)-dependent dehydrogenase (short-subunit alcohol dehydrogenase family)